MAAHAADLSVRQHDRFLCDFAAEIAIDAQSGGAVRLSPSVLNGRSLLPAKVVDISRGGLGLCSRVYLPLSCLLQVEVSGPGAGGPLSLSVRVHRVAMTDRSPSYYIGTGFEEMEPRTEARLGEILAHLHAAGAALAPEKARA